MHLKESALLRETKSSFDSINSLNSLKLPPIPISKTALKTKSLLSIETTKFTEIIESDLDGVKKSLETEWVKTNIPENLRESFREKIYPLSRHKAYSIISREINDLSKSKSLVQIAIRAVIAREESLKNLHDIDKYFSSLMGWEALIEVQLETAELLHSHRILTLSAVESIVR